jgi:hypothetical protein
MLDSLCQKQLLLVKPASFLRLVRAACALLARLLDRLY